MITAAMQPEIRSHLNTGREHYLAAEYQKALSHLSKVLEHHDDYADVHNMLGVCLQHVGRTLEAKDHFERAFQLNPSYTEASLNLAVCYNELGRYDDAKAVYARAAEGSENRSSVAVENLDGFVRGKLANLHRDLGLAYEGVGMLEPAIEQYRQALQLCPTFVDIRTKLGTTLRDAGFIDESIAELTGARDAKPDYMLARLHLGVSLWTAKRKEAAVIEWRAVLEHDPENKRAHMYLRMAKDE
jgi:tetratricopeptide (TPR) repeat protein